MQRIFRNTFAGQQWDERLIMGGRISGPEGFIFKNDQTKVWVNSQGIKCEFGRGGKFEDTHYLIVSNQNNKDIKYPFLQPPYHFIYNEKCQFYYFENKEDPFSNKIREFCKPTELKILETSGEGDWVINIKLSKGYALTQEYFRNSGKADPYYYNLLLTKAGETVIDSRQPYFNGLLPNKYYDHKLHLVKKNPKYPRDYYGKHNWLS